MNEHDTALWWAKIRSGGPQQAPAGSPSPAGMRRLVEPDAQSVWFLPNLPPSAAPEVLAEYRQEPATLQDSAGTLRVFAACLRCCWPDPGTDLWPGQPADLTDVDQVLQQLTPGRDRASRRKLLSASLRRLEASRWVLQTADRVRLGPRVTGWGSLELSTLRELWRMIPDPQPKSDPGGGEAP
ncbi:MULTISPECIES: hypothetical protein [Micromonospora]|uniref:Uncharacterized protein n=1 Tax=Micromonospora aurantiaca (nom. illeg.) TaxID=47850 RepID=A0A6N3K662_9ACTN|nr:MULTISPECIES: hypothetical protein [Micromonospora]AXH93655.1 hypothetical protein DVH21_29165 [Micromonospora aurantiaca]KAB1118646.1 hypothetical protein F6X54_02675 [Micromonospora aurantiaca]MDG4752799.1 hypothetical protein [Micromonospora sp. WMMD718]MDO3686516.1 hypothetical protein [Micromonospora sp. C28ISP2-4]OHX06929.1 hypothetical protein BFV98_30115 [Micromonospora sp. WMMB235]